MPSSGPAAYLGFLATGIEAWFNYYNDTKGGFEGRRLVLDADDDGNEPARTLENVREDLADPPFAFLGMLGTANNLFVWDDINEACIPHLFVVTGAAEWGADIAAHPWTVGVLPTYQLEMAALIRHLEENEPGARRIAVLYQNDDFGESYLAGLEKAVADTGGDFEIVARESHERGEVLVDSQMTDLASSDADVWVGGILAETCTNALRYLGESSWDPIRYISNTCSSNNFLDAAGPPGASGTSLYAAGVITGRFNENVDDPEVIDKPGIQEYLQNIEKYAPAGRPLIPSVGLFPTGWQIGWLFTTALEQAAELTRPAIMESVRSLDVVGPVMVDGVPLILDGADDPFPFEAVSFGSYQGGSWEDLGVYDFEGRTMDYVDRDRLAE